jgi:hypothetical protein
MFRLVAMYVPYEKIVAVTEDNLREWVDNANDFVEEKIELRENVQARLDFFRGSKLSYQELEKEYASCKETLDYCEEAIDEMTDVVNYFRFLLQAITEGRNEDNKDKLIYLGYERYNPTIEDIV